MSDFLHSVVMDDWQLLILTVLHCFGGDTFDF